MAYVEAKSASWASLWAFGRNIAAVSIVLFSWGWYAHDYIEARERALDVQIQNVAAQASAVAGQARELAVQTVNLATQVTALTRMIDAEATQRQQGDLTLNRRIDDTERSRRAEESGIVQRIDGIMNRIDGIVGHINRSSIEKRGDITVPDFAGG